MNPTPQTPQTLAEIERLTNCLQKANAQTEHFERQWYLVGDERDRLRAENEALRADAERYRWLCENRCDVTMCASSTDYGDGDRTFGPRVELDPDQYPRHLGDIKPKLDALIDALTASRANGENRDG